MVTFRSLIVLATLMTALASCAYAQDTQPADPPKAKPNDKKTPEAEKDPAERFKWKVSEHEVTVAGERFAYTATAGYMPLMNDDGEPQAKMFFIAYTRNGIEDLGERPVMFCFNGGPGSSAIWLHLGAFGPRRVELTDKGEAVGPPYRLVENPRSILDTTDLVFIDPISTGFSHTEEKVNAGTYHTTQGDIRSIGQFVRRYLTYHDRWASPKLLAGESYGTTRAAGLANHLQQSRGIYVNGIVLVSAVMNFQTLRGATGNDLPYQLYLPTYTAVAHYHKQLPDELQERKLDQLLPEVERYAIDVYGPALMRGAALPKAQREALIDKLASLTGLDRQVIVDHKLRIPQHAFGMELLRAEQKNVGRFDARFVTDKDGAAGDPSYAVVHGGFTGAFNRYVREELGFKTDREYKVLARLNWDFGARNRYLDTATDLRRAMNANPKLKVYVAAGYYDLATPYFAAHYTVDHTFQLPAMRDRIAIGHYEAGHMMFTHTDSLTKLKGELKAFVEDAAKR